MSHDFQGQPGTNHDRRLGRPLPPMLCLVVGGVLAVALGPKPQGAKHALVSGGSAYLAAVAVIAILLFYRICRMGARFDDRGITIRKLFRTNRITWPEVSHFADGEIVWGGENGGRWWALKIVLHHGRAVTAQATMRIPWRAKAPWAEPASAEVLATIEQVAARYQIPAQLAGRPSPPG